jgi:hypothetical protein
LAPGSGPVSWIDIPTATLPCNFLTPQGGVPHSADLAGRQRAEALQRLRL